MELQAKDLRKGNIVKNDVLDIFKKGYVVLEARNIYELAVHESGQYSDEYAKYFKSIPITEDWLLRFGFEKHEILGSYNIGSFRFHTQRPNQDAKGFNLVTEINYSGKLILVSGGCKHIHRLQNIYFALTNKELTLK